MKFNALFFFFSSWVATKIEKLHQPNDMISIVVWIRFVRTDNLSAVRGKKRESSRFETTNFVITILTNNALSFGITDLTSRYIFFPF